jgi:hypothetical protein
MASDKPAKPADRPRMKSDKEEMTASLRDSIQASIDHAEAERQREMFRRRLDIARRGLESYQEKNHKEAAMAFLSYIQVLERWKKVEPGKLTLANFDTKADIHEILLLSGVYWDLCKIYDQTSGAQSLERLRHFLHQYYIFAKGMPFAGVSAETLRRYLRSSTVRHKSEFKKSYKLLSGHNCFVVTSLVDHTDDQTVEHLRAYRDGVLKTSWHGRVLVGFYYYAAGPVLARVLDLSPEWLRRFSARVCDRLAKRVRGLV